MRAGRTQLAADGKIAGGVGTGLARDAVTLTSRVLVEALTAGLTLTETGLTCITTSGTRITRQRTDVCREATDRAAQADALVLSVLIRTRRTVSTGRRTRVVLILAGRTHSTRLAAHSRGEGTDGALVALHAGTSVAVTTDLAGSAV